jgi:LuxR family maltose regulon positive regulatory protein
MRQPSKIVAPRHPDAIRRTRLLARLDALRRSGGALWIEGSPGSGKTTLLASWIRARRVPVLWLKVDEADKDHATFFHYLALAANQVTQPYSPLPVLTAEYGDSHEAFARTFFRQLFLALPRRTVVILDDVQEANGPFHRVLRAALEEAIPLIPICFSSRGPAPPALVRFRASGLLSVLDESQLRLTNREAAALARRRGFHGSDADLETLVRDAHGWPAGVVLRVLEVRRGRTPPRDAAEHQFFASEVFDRLDASTRRLLMESALLPPATEALLVAVTGAPTAGVLVAGLAERGLFTLRLETSPAAYDFHAPFRDFLCARAGEELSASRRAEVRRTAARLLSEEGRAGAEAAIALLAEAGADDELAALVTREAPGALKDGRWQTVERWLAAVPAERREQDPWLLLWGGVAAMAKRPREAQASLARALQLFESAGLAAGVWLAWAAGVEAVVAEWNDLGPLRGALLDHDRLQARFPVPAGEVEVRVLLAVQAAAMLVRPDHPSLPGWCQGLRALARSAPLPALRLAAGAQLVLHEAWLLGEVERHRDLLQDLGRLARAPETPPALASLWLSCQAPVEFAAGNLDACAETAARSIEHGASHGIQSLDFVARAQEFSVALVRAPESVTSRLRAMERALRPGAGVDQAVSSWAHGLAALRRDEVTEAVRSGEKALALACGSSYAVGQVLARLLLARANARAGDPAGARASLGEARALGERSGSNWLRCITAFIEAEHLLQEGRCDDWAAPLAEAFASWRDKGVHPFLLFGPDEVAHLCAAALERGILVETVLSFIKTWKISSPSGAPRLQSWPWPVRILALGALTVEREGRPVGADGRVPRKPFDILRVLVACGGREVPEHVIAEALWPDAEGDAAQHALETTLYRLRRMVGPEVVVQRDRRLSLAPERCWVDAFEVEALLAEALSPGPRRRDPSTEASAERIADLYRGPLLVDADDAVWAVEARNRLRGKTARWLQGLSSAEGSGGSRLEALCEMIRARDPALRSTTRLRIA